MKGIYLYFSLCLCLFSCSQEKKYYEDGRLHTELVKKIFSENKFTYFYESGEKSAEGYVDKNGYPIGKWTGYREKGDVFWECEYAENICLDSVIKSVEEQDVRCYIYKWMKQYYEGVVSMDYLQIDSLWNVRMFYKEYGRGKMYACGDMDKSGKKTGRWNYYYADGKLAHSFVYKSGVGPVMSCERLPIKLSIDVSKTEEMGVDVYYFRFFSYDINPEMSCAKIFPWDEHDTLHVNIYNQNTKGENSSNVYPYRIESPIIYNFGGKDNYILIGYYFQNSECDVNPNNKLFFISIKDLRQKDVVYYLDEETGKFFIKSEK